MTRAVATNGKKVAKRAPAVTTLVTFVLDETGSMGMVRDATISGFNEYVDGLRGQAKMLWTLTKFNLGRVEVLQSGVPIKDAVELNYGNYVPNDLTPLYDAVASAIQATEKAMKGVRGKKRVLCVIMTDGEENASHEWTKEKLFTLITEKQAEGNWTFAFLGANQDAWGVAQAIGVPQASSVNYSATPQGTRSAMAAARGATVSYASSSAPSSRSFFAGKRHVDDDEDAASA